MIKSLIDKIRVQIYLATHKKGDQFEIDKKVIAKYLPASPVIIDCGAHTGADSIQLAKIKGSRVYAFEAVHKIFDRLVTNTRKARNLTCINIALSNHDGLSKIFVSSGNSDGSSSLLPPKEVLVDHPNIYFKAQETVICKKLDSWAAENNISHIDMLWLDMQGAEEQMLEASPLMLKTVKVIHSEISMRETYEGAPVYDEYKKFLADKGFKVVIEAIPEGTDMGNVLFVRN